MITPGMEFPILDDGFVRVVDSMGSDESIVNAARLTVKNLKPFSDNRGLIRYLMRHRHSTPFEFCQLVLHIRCPMDVWRQWIRHRTASVNEYSTRYSEAIDSMAKTDPKAWRLQALKNRQGSDGHLSEEDGRHLSFRELEFHETAKMVYQERLLKGVAREQARKDLPLSNYTEAFWSIDLHNLLHFLSLRMDSHAQAEIRAYAEVIGEEIVAKWVPVTWEAFKDYRLEALTLSRNEQELLLLILDRDRKQVLRYLQALHWTNSSCREWQEFEEKLIALKITFDWPWKVG